MGGRRKGIRNQRDGLYIVGEGLTEQFYFDHLKSIKNYSCHVKPKFFGNTDIDQIRKIVERLLLGNVEIICVFDTDVSSRNKVENVKLEEFKKKYLQNPLVIVCDSFPTIEYWFILHYLDNVRNFSSSKEVLKELKKFIRKYEKTKKFLGNQKWVEEMTSCLDEAMQNATCVKLDSIKSFSNIYKAINKLEKKKNHK